MIDLPGEHFSGVPGRFTVTPPVRSAKIGIHSAFSPPLTRPVFGSPSGAGPVVVWASASRNVSTAMSGIHVVGAHERVDFAAHHAFDDVDEVLALVCSHAATQGRWCPLRHSEKFGLPRRLGPFRRQGRAKIDPLGRLGHASIETTARYLAELDSQPGDSVADVLDRHHQTAAPARSETAVSCETPMAYPPSG